MRVTWVPIDTVIPYARNPRKNAAAVPKVAGLLKEFGWRQPIVVDREMIVVVGHTRLEAARSLGERTVPIHVAGDLTAAQAKAYRIADNRSHEDATWDEDLLQLEVADLRELGFDTSLTAFSPGQLAQLDAGALAGTGEDPGVGGYQEQWGVIVICTDEAEQQAIYERLAAEGLKVRVVAT